MAFVFVEDRPFKVQAIGLILFVLGLLSPAH